jgi:hypothetical protein
LYLPVIGDDEEAPAVVANERLVVVVELALAGL